MRLRHFFSLGCAALAWLCPAWTHAQLPAAIQRFDAGIQHFAGGNYQDAVHAFEEVLAMGYVNGALYYNTGNAYFRMDDYGQALRYWRKARRLMQDEPALNHNIAMVESLIGTPFTYLPSPFWVSWWQRAIMPAGSIPYLIAGLATYLLSILLFGIRIRTRTQKNWQRRLRAGSLVVGLIMLLTAFGASYSRNGVFEGVVISQSATLSEVESQPGELAVPAGVVVKLLGRADNHYRVRLPNGVTGYLSMVSIGEI